MRDSKQACKQPKRTARPLNSERLRELALNYVARFSTSSGKLEAYLRRKIYERGWEDDREADVAALVSDFAQRGYIDDENYARMRSSDLLRRGYGARRVGETLRGAGIGEEIREAVSPGEGAARRAALHLARKRRLGPFALDPPDQAKREKQLAAMLRAGHSFDMARRLIEAESAEDALEWASEYDDEEEHDRFA